MKKVLVLTLSLATSLTLFAQKGVEDGSKYGHGEDSIRCIQNLSLYQTYAKQKDYGTALEFWEIAYKECPASSINLYITGTQIRKWQLQREHDPAKKKEFFDLLMQVYDQRIEYFGNYVRAPRPAVLGLKGVDYLTCNPEGEDADKSVAYPWLKTCIEESPVQQFNPAYGPYFMIASRAMLDNPEADHKQTFFSDYLKIMEMIDAKIAETPDTTTQAKYRGYKQDIDDILVKSGAADCMTLENIFAPELEANKANLDWLNKVITLFKRVRCTDTEVYFQASLYAHEVAPTSESAEGCAYMCIKKEDYAKAAEYLTEAIRMASDDDKKAEYEYLAATALFAGKKFSDARQHALAAAKYRSGYADPYILIAKMYANSVDQFSDNVTKRAVYWVAVDKLEKAKSVDPSVAGDVNDLIARYKEQYPNSEDVFMHPEVDEGKPYLVKGWINERTIARSKK